MATLTDPLRQEHQHLLPHLEQLRAAADAIGVAPSAEAHAFLVNRLLPHAQAEEAALYPLVARLMGAPEATATMSRDHVAIDRLTAELGTLRTRLQAGAPDLALERDVHRVLYGLHTLIRVHFDKEEEVYLPLLDARLDVGDAHALFSEMEQAAATANHTPRVGDEVHAH